MQVRQALEYWTAGMLGLGVVTFITQPAYMGCGQSAWPGLSQCDMAKLFPILVVFVVSYVGALVLAVAAMVRAFRRADPSTASGHGATAEGPPKEQPRSS